MSEFRLPPVDPSEKKPGNHDPAPPPPSQEGSSIFVIFMKVVLVLVVGVFVLTGLIFATCFLSVR